MFYRPLDVALTTVSFRGLRAGRAMESYQNHADLRERQHGLSTTRTTLHIFKVVNMINMEKSEQDIHQGVADFIKLLDRPSKGSR